MKTKVEPIKQSHFEKMLRKNPSRLESRMDNEDLDQYERSMSKLREEKALAQKKPDSVPTLAQPTSTEIRSRIGIVKK